MKRSEMIKLLKNSTVWLNESTASEVLDVIEAAGMLPPARPFSDDLGTFYEVHSWELEESKKLDKAEEA